MCDCEKTRTSRRLGYFRDFTLEPILLNLLLFVAMNRIFNVLYDC